MAPLGGGFRSFADEHAGVEVAPRSAVGLLMIGRLKSTQSGRSGPSTATAAHAPFALLPEASKLVRAGGERPFTFGCGWLFDDLGSAAATRNSANTAPLSRRIARLRRMQRRSFITLLSGAAALALTSVGPMYGQHAFGLEPKGQY